MPTPSPSLRIIAYEGRWIVIGGRHVPIDWPIVQVRPSEEAKRCA